MKSYKYLFVKFLAIVFLTITLSSVAFASTTDGTISVTNHSALLCGNDPCTTTSQINFKTTLGTPIHITDTSITGYAWAENFGWINFSPTTAGVMNTSNGILSGYAWGENAGWINFSPTNGGVSINSSGKFTGWAWAQNYGWIRFNCNVANACVETDWRPLSVRGSGSSGGSYGGSTGGNSGGGTSTSGGAGGATANTKDVCPNISGTQTIIPSGLVITSAGNCITPQQCNVIDGNLKQPLDAIIIIDKSGSMAGTKLAQAKSAADAFISNLVNGSDRVGYVTYSTSATLVSGLTTSLSAVNTKIQGTVTDANTNIGGAIKLAYQEMNNNGRSGVKHVIILMTDGEANVSDIKTLSPNQYAINQSSLAKVDGTIVYTIGLGSSVDSTLLKSVATQESNYYYSPTGNDLSNIYLKIAAIECTAAPSKVSDAVIYDKNSNGVYDSGEPGLANVVVSLISKNNSQPTREEKSSSTGNFAFSYVAPGDYYVCIDSPSGMVQTSPKSSGCYSISVIQGVSVSSTKFLVAGKVTPVTPPVPPVTPPVTPPVVKPVTPPVVPVVPPVTPPVVPVVPVDPNTPTNPVDPTTYPPLDNINPVTPSDNKDKKQDSTTSKDSGESNKLVSKIGDFFAYILGTTDGGSGIAITQNSFSGVKQELNSITYIAGLISQKAIDETTKIFKSGTGKAVSTVVATGGAATGLYFGVVNVAFANPLSFAEIFLTPMRLWTLLLIALGIKKRNVPWGTVYDSVTKQPLDPAYVVLQNLNGDEIATSITDLDGRYGFLVPPGQYKLLASKTNYEFPSKKLSGRNSDELYNELYFSEVIEVQDGGVIRKNIPMDPIKFDWNEFAKKDKNLMRFFSKRELIIARVADFLFAFGFIVTFISMLVSPVIYNIIIFVLYVLMIILQKTILKPRAFGHIKQKETQTPLSFAIMRVFFNGSDNEVIHKVADQTGKYYCLIPNGTYYTKIENKNPDESYSLVHTSGPIEVKEGYINKMFEV